MNLHSRQSTNLEQLARRTGFPIEALEAFAKHGMLGDGAPNSNPNDFLRNVEAAQRAR